MEHVMVDKIRVFYLFDPLCGWCYGAQPVLEKITSLGAFEVELVPTGLFAGEGARPMDESFAAYAWSNDQRIGHLTGQVFSEDYRRRILADHARLFDSRPASLALTAVALSVPSRERDALKAIQRTRYVDGRDTTDPGVLAEVLNDLDLGAAADRILAPDDDLLEVYRRRISDGRATMRQFGIDGVPALLVGAGEDRRPVRASALFEDIDALLASLRAA
jgi:putative protein-disulfide isomerase